MDVTPQLRSLIADCDDAQRAAITSDTTPLLVLASAGSGKTRVLTRRIAWSVLTGRAKAKHVLALTFTRKAANELRERLSTLGLPTPVTAGTFHAIALAQLRQRALDAHRTPPAILDSKARLLGRVVADDSRSNTPDRRTVLSGIAGEIEWAKARLIDPTAYEKEALAARRTPTYPIDLIARAYAGYEIEKRRRRVLDFDDLLIELAAQMVRDADFRATQQWRFRHFFVDELQDANPAQLHLLDAWLGGRTDLFAVGDPRQAIYGWNGADLDAINGFSNRYGHTTVLSLDTNYRSTPQVVELAGSTLDQNGFFPIEAARPDGAIPTITSYPDEREEARGITGRLRSAKSPGHTWSHFAVLARTNSQLLLIEQALVAAGIPCRSGGSARYLERPIIKGVLSSLRADDDAHSFASWRDELQRMIDGIGDQADDIDADTMTSSTYQQERDELGSLAQLAHDYERVDPSPRGSGFLAFVREALRTEPSPTRSDAVDLVTFHRAKGLEWPVVFVTGLENGLVPIGYAKTDAALEEERRLLYVALSRAEEELHCSWAQERAFGSRVHHREPSPYLLLLDEALEHINLSMTPGRDLARQGIAESRAALGRPSGM